jgi:hypothetical protein
MKKNTCICLLLIFTLSITAQPRRQHPIPDTNVTYVSFAFLSPGILISPQTSGTLGLSFPYLSQVSNSGPKTPYTYTSSSTNLFPRQCTQLNIASMELGTRAFCMNMGAGTNLNCGGGNFQFGFSKFFYLDKDKLLTTKIKRGNAIMIKPSISIDYNSFNAQAGTIDNSGKTIYVFGDTSAQSWTVTQTNKGGTTTYTYNTHTLDIYYKQKVWGLVPGVSFSNNAYQRHILHWQVNFSYFLPFYENYGLNLEQDNGVVTNPLLKSNNLFPLTQSGLSVTYNSQAVSTSPFTFRGIYAEASIILPIQAYGPRPYIYIRWYDNPKESIDNRQQCYGYYVTNQGQKLKATFVIITNHHETGAQCIENLQYGIYVLQEDSTLKELVPGEIKSYKIENWGHTFFTFNLFTNASYHSAISNRSITDSVAEFETVRPANKPYHFYPQIYNKAVFMYVYKKNDYINTYYWYRAAITGKNSPPKYLDISPVVYNNTTHWAIGGHYLCTYANFFSDDTLLSSLINKRYLSRTMDVDLMFKEYIKWRRKEDYKALPDSLNPFTVEHYPNSHTDTSYVLKAIIDANLMYTHRGLFLASYLITTVLSPVVFIPYVWIVNTRKLKYPAKESSNTVLMSNDEYTSTYKRRVDEIKDNRLEGGFALGLLTFTTICAAILAR